MYSPGQEENKGFKGKLQAIPLLNKMNVRIQSNNYYTDI